MKTLKELLIEFDAHIQIQEWAGDKNIEEFVKECHKGEWLLWFAKKLQLPERKIIACAGHCVNTVRNLIEDENSIQLLDMYMNFEDKSISFKDLEKAREAVYAAAVCADYAAADYAADYAAAAAEDAFYTTRAAVCAAVCADYAAASFAARVAARVAAYEENELQTANIVRERLGMDIINKVNKLLNN